MELKEIEGWRVSSTKKMNDIDLENGVINPLGSASTSTNVPSSSSRVASQTDSPSTMTTNIITSSGRTASYVEMMETNTGSGTNNQPPRETLFGSFSGSVINRDTFQKLAKFKLVRLIQYFCFGVSLSGCVYFMSKQYINVSLQYFQICFISTLTVCLDSESWYKQRVFFVLSYLVACGWAMAWIWAGYKYLSWQLYNYVTGGMCSFFFLNGMLSATYVALNAPAEVKYVELDLLLYLVSLNAICFFSNDDVFNNNLHMILDIRTLVLLYTCLHQPKQKMELLNSATFIIIMIIVIIVFIIYSNDTNIANATGNSLYVIIGMLLMYEAYSSHLRFKQRFAEEKRLSKEGM